MTRTPRILLAVVLVVLSIVAGWRVIATAIADHLAVEHPQAALRWQPDHPAALLNLAERQLADGDIAKATATARHLLRVAPLQGRAFTILAHAGEASTDPKATRALHEIAARRAPHVVRPHAWLAEHDLGAGDFESALHQIDLLLRVSPGAGAYLFPLMAEWTANPEFARALATRLRQDPAWRPGMLRTLSAQVTSSGANAVYAALRAQGGLSAEETGRWLNALISAGEWNQAYSHWASGLDLEDGASLSVVYNGGFELPASGAGFDWRIGNAPGAITEFEAAPGASDGQTAHVSFRGRPVDGGNLEQALLLAPGSYRLAMRMRALVLRSDQGLYWTLTCDGQPRPFATGEKVGGSFEWRDFTLEFDVPLTDCPGQWLRLENPAPKGSARMVSGNLWIDGIVIRANRTPRADSWSVGTAHKPVQPDRP